MQINPQIERIVGQKIEFTCNDRWMRDLFENA